MKKLPNDWKKIFATDLSKYPKNSYYSTSTKILALCKCSVEGSEFEKVHKRPTNSVLPQFSSVQFSSVHSLSHVRLFVTP